MPEEKPDKTDLKRLEAELVTLAGRATEALQAGFAAVIRGLNSIRVTEDAARKAAKVVTDPRTSVDLIARGLAEVCIKTGVPEGYAVQRVQAAFAKRRES